MSDKKIGTLIKVFPIKRQINQDTEYDSLLMFYRDKDGIKRTRFIERAEVPFYIIKDKNSEEALSPPMFIERDKVEKSITYSDMLYREIAVRTDSLSYYDRCMTSGRQGKTNLKNLLKHNYIYDSDMDIADRYIKNFMEEFEPDIGYQLHKTYMDIEVDLLEKGLQDKGYIGFPEEDIAPCPVNIITLIDSKSLTIHTFIHDNKNNQSLQDYLATIATDPNAVKQELIQKIYERNNILYNDVIFYTLPTELETIETFFKVIHEIDPDVCASWNQTFDVNTLINRLIQLYDKHPELLGNTRGYDKMLTTVSDMKYSFVKSETGREIYISPKARYMARKDKSIVDRMDEFTVLDGIFWIDQMIVYANIRKAQMKESYALDAIANDELGSEKLDYTGYTIKNLPWKNFKLFTEYNILDVVLLHALENKNLDFDMLQKLQEVTNTRKYKVFKKTVSIKNFVCKFAELQGFVMSNNRNASYGNDSDYFETQYLERRELKEPDEDYMKAFLKKENFGAYVADPNLNDLCGIEDSNGNKSQFVYEFVFDEDFSALYPSIIRAFNLDKNTQVGKFYLLEDDIKSNLIDKFGYAGLFSVSKNEEADGGETTSDIGPTLVDSLMSHNWSRIGEKYFDLPSTSDMIQELLSK